MLLFSRYWRCWAGSWKSRGAFERNVAAAARRLRLVISRLFQTISESKMVSLATQFLKVLKGKRVKVTVKSTSYTGVIERISQNPNKILVLSEGQSIMYFVYLLFFVCMSAPHILEEDKKHGAVLVFFFFFAVSRSDGREMPGSRFFFDHEILSGEWTELCEKSEQVTSCFCLTLCLCIINSWGQRQRVSYSTVWAHIVSAASPLVLNLSHAMCCTETADWKTIRMHQSFRPSNWVCMTTV